MTFDPAEDRPLLSVVIPVFNEEQLVAKAVRGLCDELRATGDSFEVLLAENGSWDGTIGVLEQLTAELPEVRFVSVPRPNYGLALRTGLLLARGRYLVCEEIDLCDVDFQQRALQLLEQDAADLVIGSKLMTNSRDRRPLNRRVASRAYSQLLRSLFGFSGTDTHGLKVLRAEALLPVVSRCVVDKDVYASELVLRAEQEGLRVAEIPITIAEKRLPSIHLARRVPAVFVRLAKLFVALRRGPRPS